MVDVKHLFRVRSIIIIIIIRFYIVLNTSTMSLSALQIRYYPGHWIQCLPEHTVCTISTPWGLLQPVYVIQPYKDLDDQNVNNDSPLLTANAI